jgi:hypothetical protein
MQFELVVLIAYIYNIYIYMHNHKIMSLQDLKKKQRKAITLK